MESSAKEIARIVNEEIRALAERLHARDRANDLYGFFCEDGCGETAPMTLAAFIAAGGAWLDGHKPEK